MGMATIVAMTIWMIRLPDPGSMYPSAMCMPLLPRLAS